MNILFSQGSDTAAKNRKHTKVFQPSLRLPLILCGYHFTGLGWLLCMKKEQWKTIAGYEGYYEVSSMGRVKSVRRHIDNGKGGKGSVNSIQERILKQTLTGKGKYPYVGLHKDGHRKNVTVHSLVFKAFVPNPANLPEINHRDGNKLNNLDTNLEPSTRAHNVHHAISTGLLNIKGERNHFAKLTEFDVRRARRLFADGICQKTIAEVVKTTPANIHCIVRRKSWEHL